MSMSFRSPSSATRQLINLLRCLLYAIEIKVIDPQSAKLRAGHWPRRLDPNKIPELPPSKKLPRDKAYSTRVSGLLSLNWFQDLDSVLLVVEDWLKRQTDLDPGIDELDRLKEIRTTAICLDSRLRLGFRESELMDDLMPVDELTEEIIWWANEAYDWVKSFAVPPPNPPNRRHFGPYIMKIVRGDGPDYPIHAVFQVDKDEGLRDDQPATARQNDQPAKAPRDDRPAKATLFNTSKGKCIAYLLAHHEYDCKVTAYELNQTPATPKELAMKGITSAASATRFFKDRWKSHAEYKRVCDEPKRLLLELQLMAGDMPVRKLGSSILDLEDHVAAKLELRRESSDESD